MIPAQQPTATTATHHDTDHDTDQNTDDDPNNDKEPRWPLTTR
ncbi:MAG: hypothetical protein RIS41_461 [Actinomycetota bacterium]|jgi:hypothetical protein